VKLPTAYMVPPHCANCLTCITDDVTAGKCGVHAAGVVETGPPVAPKAGAARPRVNVAVTAALANLDLFDHMNRAPIRLSLKVPPPQRRRHYRRFACVPMLSRVQSPRWAVAGHLPEQSISKGA
jgi:hypothetical protein